KLILLQHSKRKSQRLRHRFRKAAHTVISSSKMRLKKKNLSRNTFLLIPTDCPKQTGSGWVCLQSRYGQLKTTKRKAENFTVKKICRKSILFLKPITSA